MLSDLSLTASAGAPALASAIVSSYSELPSALRCAALNTPIWSK
jgi:hypothetical protein